MEFALIGLWLIVYYLLALVGLPASSALFPRFPDRGATFALPISLTVITIVTYWLGQFAFTTVTVTAAVVVFAALFTLLARGGLEIDRRGYAEAMVVFTAAFSFLVFVRAIDPAIVATGGEKFLDFGLLKSLMRAPALPPEDMWFAGEPVRYYYGGHLIAAILTKLTGTAPRFSYNLALAGFYGMLVSTAYGLARAIAIRYDAPSRLAGLFAAFFVGFAGNTFTTIRLLANVLPRPLVEIVATPLEMEPGSFPLEPLDFWYWDASRVMVGTINEFPLFAYINGDLHAHMMGQPFLLFVTALSYAVYRSHTEIRWRKVLVWGALPPAVAFLGTISFWSFPTALGIVWLAVTFAEDHPATLIPGGKRLMEERSGFADELVRTATAMAIAIVVGLLALLWAGPFVVNILFGSATTRSIGFFPDRTSLVELLIVHGAFLLPFALYLGTHVRWHERDATQVGVLGGLLLVLGWQGGFAVVVVVAPLLVVGWLLLRADSDLGFETVLLVAGAGLVLLVEFVYVQDNAIAGRFNTVFKVYMQVWAFWSVSVGVVLMRLLTDSVPGYTADVSPEASTKSETSDPSERSEASPSVPVSRRTGVAVFTVMLLLTTSVYGAFALSEHVSTDKSIHRTDDPTLDGMAFIWTAHGDEARAIEWLDAKEGRPHIVSAPGKPYQWGSPASSLTGLPTVVGWYQERIYRGAPAYEERKRDVELIFSPNTGWSTRAGKLAKYDVRYIYYGPQERQRYGRTSFSKYPGIEPVHRSGSVSIYRVNQTIIENQPSVSA
ncbi:DUF2298 domain-containing protein [Haladaptatus caseinilyticus]|uniref:DUF2298 domain-containing protein n=1 Tax=Haladaptatus caseinilyticus TaxID=2993314 RepID=UPI00224B1C73|nr:DUF2298 domain-containing protein [Haladaptatus caseinilyticus]